MPDSTPTLSPKVLAAMDQALSRTNNDLERLNVEYPGIMNHMTEMLIYGIEPNPQAFSNDIKSKATVLLARYALLVVVTKTE